MVWVPAGMLDFGDTLYPEEQPVRKIAVAGFWMDRTEVRNNDFAAYAKPSANFDRINFNWHCTKGSCRSV